MMRPCIDGATYLVGASEDRVHTPNCKDDRNTYHIHGISCFRDTSGLQDLRISPAQTSFSILLSKDREAKKDSPSLILIVQVYYHLIGWQPASPSDARGKKDTLLCWIL